VCNGGRLDEEAAHFVWIPDYVIVVQVCIELEVLVEAVSEDITIWSTTATFGTFSWSRANRAISTLDTLRF